MPYCFLCDRKLSKERELSLFVCKKCLGNFILLNAEYRLDNEFLNSIDYTILFKLEGSIKNLVYRYKFYKELKLAEVISNLFLENLNFKESYDYIVPMPSHKIKIIKNGFLPVYYLTKILSNKTKIEYLPCLNKKIFPLKEQKKLNKKERTSMPNNILCSKNLDGKNILLIDDIITTGQTLKNSCDILLQHGSKKVTAYILALS